MGLNLNTPQVKNYTGLNPVRSGSTAETDNNVKYVPQDLTEAQKAQARQNIGAGEPQVQADWNQTDTTAPDYIKNKPEITPGGATINEFHYLRDTTTDPATFYIDADGYEPQEGDLMTIVWDWPFRTNESEEVAFKNPATLKNNSTNPSIYIKNAHQMETDYDEIDPEVNTRWTVRLEKVNDVWYAYNISTAVQADWTTVDTHAPSYIKNKPSIPEDAIPEDFSNSITIWSEVNTILKSSNNMTAVYNNGIKTVLDANTKQCNIAVGKNVVIAPGAELNFNNKDAEYWAWCPRNYQKNNTIFKGNHDNLNVVYFKPSGYWDGGYWNNSFGANSKIFNLGNAVWQGWPTSPTPIVFVDKPISLNAPGVPSTLPNGFGAYMYVPKVRYAEFLNACTTRWPDTPVDKFKEKIIVYDHLVQNGYKLLIVPIEKKNYFYVENTTNAEETVTITKNGNAPICSFEISTNTFTWTKLGNTSSTPLTITLPAGEKRYLRGENGVHLSNWPIWSEYTGITGMDKVGGNIHSLLFGENFENTELTAPGDGGQTSAYGLAFANLFYGSTTLVDAGDLILPSKVVPHYGYSNMFMECSNLTTPPQIEAVTSVGSNNMGGIFSNCTSLTRTPVLKIEAIPQYCYDHAFSGCSSLTRVENWATSGNDNDQPGAPTDSWLDGVAAEGTFVKNPNASNWVFGKNGIPTGWTVVDK